MEYPTEFSSEARNKIEREKIIAYRELPLSFDESSCEALALRCIGRIFLAFVKEANGVRNKQGWALDRVDRESTEFLHGQLMPLILFEKFGSYPCMHAWAQIRNVGTRSERKLVVVASSHAQQLFRTSTWWSEYHDLLLLEPASESGKPKNAVQEVKRRGRSANVDDYIEEVRKAGKKITRTDIWKKAGYKSRTEFERWQRRDPKHPNSSADQKFTRILSEKPHLK